MATAVHTITLEGGAHGYAGKAAHMNIHGIVYRYLHTVWNTHELGRSRALHTDVLVQPVHGAV